MVEIILRENVKGLGKAGEVVKVKDGYARNYLIPRQLGILKTEDGLKRWEQEKRRRERKLLKEIERFKEIAKKMENVSLNIAVEANEEDMLYGSITEQNIVRALKDEGFTIDKDAVSLKEPIKKLGVYVVEIVLHPEVKTSVKLWVVRK